MKNTFKLKQDQDKRQRLLADCVAMAATGNAACLSRAVAKFMKEAGVSKSQAEEALARAR